MPNQKYKCSFLFIVQTLLTLCLSWKYQVHTFSNKYKESPQQKSQLEQFEEFNDIIEKTVYLESGEILQCKIPLQKSSLPPPNFEQEIQQVQIGKKIVLNQEEANLMLAHLNNACVHYFKTDFIYEFCFQKYIKQFDDEYTIRNAKKSKEELIFIGFFEKYQKETNQTAYQFQTPSMQLPSQFLFVNPQEKSDIYIQNDTILFRNDVKNNLREQKIPTHIRAIVSNKQANDKVGQDIQVLSIKIKHFIDGKVGIIDKKHNNGQIPDGVVTNNYEIIYSDVTKADYEESSNVMISINYHIYGQTIYNHKKMHGFTQYSQGDCILIVMEDGEHIITYVEHIWTNNVIRVADFIVENGEAKYLFVLEKSNDFPNNENKYQQKMNWVSLEKNKIKIGDNYLINADSRLKKGDFIKVIPVNSPNQQFIVSKIVHNIAKLEGPSGNFEGFYVVKQDRKNQSNKQTEFKQNKYQSGYHFGLQDIRFSNYWHIEDKSEYMGYLDNEIFNLTQYNNQVQIKIKMQFLDCSKCGGKLRLLLTENLVLDQGIEIIFYANGVVKVFEQMSQGHQSVKNEFFSGLKGFKNEVFWIVIQKQNIRLGFGPSIAGTAELLNHKITNNINMNYLRINMNKTQKIIIDNIMVQKISTEVEKAIQNYSGHLLREFIQVNRTSDVLNNNYNEQKLIIDGELDKQVEISYEEKFRKLFSTKFQQEGTTLFPDDQIVYSEIYKNGEYCEAVKDNRITQVNYKCGQNIFAIQSIKEDKICHYTIEVQTKFLCQPDKKEKENYLTKFHNVNDIYCVPMDIL